MRNNFLRYPKTAQECREFYDAEEQEVHIRPARKPNNLPDAYDDIFISKDKADWNERKPWKSKRGKQYRPKT